MSAAVDVAGAPAAATRKRSLPSRLPDTRRSANPPAGKARGLCGSAEDGATAIALIISFLTVSPRGGKSPAQAVDRAELVADECPPPPPCLCVASGASWLSPDGAAHARGVFPGRGISLPIVSTSFYTSMNHFRATDSLLLFFKLFRNIQIRTCK